MPRKYVYEFDPPILRDLYFLVKFLPAYALPAGMPSTTDVTQFRPETEEEVSIVLEKPPVRDENRQRNRVTSFSDPTSPLSPNSVIAIGPGGRVPPSRPLPMSLKSPTGRTSFATGVFSPRSAYSANHERVVLTKQDESFLMPAHMPPKYGLFDLFPFSLLVKFLSQRGRDVKGKKAARVRAQLKQHAISHNLPLELSLYLVRVFFNTFHRWRYFPRCFKSSYIASIQRRKICDVPTTSKVPSNSSYNNSNCSSRHPFRFPRQFGGQFDWPWTHFDHAYSLLVTPQLALNDLSLTRCYSYSIHLWLVTYLYCLFLVRWSMSSTWMWANKYFYSRSRSGLPSIGWQFLLPSS